MPFSDRDIASSDHCGHTAFIVKGCLSAVHSQVLLRSYVWLFYVLMFATMHCLGSQWWWLLAEMLFFFFLNLTQQQDEYYLFYCFTVNVTIIHKIGDIRDCLSSENEFFWPPSASRSAYICCLEVRLRPLTVASMSVSWWFIRWYVWSRSPWVYMAHIQLYLFLMSLFQFVKELRELLCCPWNLWGHCFPISGRSGLFLLYMKHLQHAWHICNVLKRAL